MTDLSPSRAHKIALQKALYQNFVKDLGKFTLENVRKFNQDLYDLTPGMPTVHREMRILNACYEMYKLIDDQEYKYLTEVIAAQQQGRPIPARPAPASPPAKSTGISTKNSGKGDSSIPAWQIEKIREQDQGHLAAQPAADGPV